MIKTVTTQTYIAEMTDDELGTLYRVAFDLTKQAPLPTRDIMSANLLSHFRYLPLSDVVLILHNGRRGPQVRLPGR